MLKALLKNSSPIIKILVTLTVIIISFLVFLILGLILGFLIFKTNILNPELLTNYDNPLTVSVLKYFQIVQSIGLFIVPPFVLGYLFTGKSFDYLKLNHWAKPMSFILVPLLIISAIPLINFMAEINSYLVLPDFMSGIEQWMKTSEESAAEVTKIFLKADGFGGLMLNVFMIALIPAVGEELLFRGVLQNIFVKWTKNAHWGIFIAAFVFSFIHFQFYGFLPRMFLGIIFGYFYVWSKSLWLSMLGHFINNGFAVVVSYFVTDQIANDKIESIGTDSQTIIFTVISVVLTFGIFYFIYKKEKGRL